MGAFFVAPRSLDAGTCEKLDQEHRRLGFQLAQKVNLTNGTLFLYRNLSGGGAHILDNGDGTFACLAGELLYKGAKGDEALRRYVRDLEQDEIDCQSVIGHFATIVKDARGLRVSADPLGFYQVYFNAAQGIISSSFWALLELLPRLNADTAGIYEYAWNGASFGGKTFIREIRRLPAAKSIRLGEELDLEDATTPDLREGDARNLTFEACVEKHAARLRGFFQDLAGAYGDRLHVSFSSGYDSRLILAGLKSAGLKPDLFVYGAEGDKDVEIARLIASAEGLRLHAIDKSRSVKPEAAASPDRQKDDFIRFDAWKVDGILDDGVDTRDRLARHAEGRVPLNGSLGEIYRNFFYIPDRPLHLRQVAQSFFSSYAPAACTRRFQAEAYLGELVRAFQSELQTSDQCVSRAEAELLYPLVRGRYWTGRDVSLNLRFGPMHFPFMQARLIGGTADIPLAFKDYGRLEGELIGRLDPALASYPSGYGFPLNEAAPLRHRAKTWLTVYRPSWLRARSYRLRFAKRRPFPGCLSTERLEALIDPSLPCMRHYFHPDSLHDPAAFNRVATMEYIFQRYSVV